MSSLRDRVKRLLSPKRALGELAISRFLTVLGSSMFAVFSSLYLYELGMALWLIVAAHSAGYLFRFFAVPLLAKYTARYGSEKSIALAIPFMLLNYTLLFFAEWWLPAFAFSVVAYQVYLSFYWTGFHVNVATNARKDSRGQDYSLISILTLIGASIAPIIGGVVIQQQSFVWLLVVAALFQGASLIPLFTTKERVEPSSFSYVLPFRLLKQRSLRKIAVGLLGWGEEMILVFVWPVFIFLLVDDYVTLGWIAGAATLVTGILTFVAGKRVDARTKTGERKGVVAHRIGAVVIAAIWVLRAFASSAVQVFALDTSAKWARSFVSLMSNTKAYDSTDQADRVAVVVFWSQWVALGKCLAGAAAALLLFFFAENLAAAFLPAAFFSLLLLLL